MTRRSSQTGSGWIAVGGIMAAGSLAFLWLACLSPAGRTGLTAVAGLFPVAAVLSAGRTAGYLCWAAAGLVGLLLLPDKGVPLLYLLFLGLYPVVKSRIESMRKQPLEWLLKVIFFNVTLAVAMVLLRSLLLPDMPAWMIRHVWIAWILMNAVFLVYDFGLTKVIAMLQHYLHLGRRHGQ